MKESDIRPQALFDDYLKAAREDIEFFFKDKSRFVSVPCPACGADDGEEVFVKDGFRYVECRACATLYASPRPPEEDLGRFYRDSKSSRFWVERFYRETEEARREKMFRPRAADVMAKAQRHLPGRASPSLVDIGAGYGTFLEEVRRLNYFAPPVAVEPAAGLAAVCEEKGFRVIRSAVEEAAPESFDVATSFELYEHVFSPDKFLKAAARLLRPGGLLYMTTLSGQGFDLLLLKEKSKSISPPHHLNFINPRSLALSLERAGFEPLEVETPGKLDVDIVLNIAKQTPVPADGFTRHLLFGAAPAAREEFQMFLQKHGLSSHIRAVARRKA